MTATELALNALASTVARELHVSASQNNRLCILTTSNSVQNPLTLPPLASCKRRVLIRSSRFSCSLPCAYCRSRSSRLNWPHRPSGLDSALAYLPRARALYAMDTAICQLPTT